MRARRFLCIAGFMTPLLLAPPGHAQSAVSPPSPAIPEIHQLLREVQDHQKAMEKVRENYTYSSMQTTQDIDAKGQVIQTKSEQGEDFFVNGHIIERTVKKNGQPLNEHDQQKETERVTKLVEKAQKTPPDQPLEGQTIRVSRLLDIMDVRNPRREQWRDRPAIVFDFVGRKNARTHGLAEDASKKLSGTIWIDEAARQVAHLEVVFSDNFKVVGGLFASVEKGSHFRFDQELVNGEIWLPTGAEGMVDARLLLVKNLRQHFIESDYDYKRFHVEAQETKSGKPVAEKKP